MGITQATVLTQDMIKRIADGGVYAFVNSAPAGEILLMSEERYEQWCQEGQPDIE